MNQSLDLEKGTKKQKEANITRSAIPKDELYQLVVKLCRFILRHIIHPEGQFSDHDGALYKDHTRLCRWAGSTRPYEPAESSDNNFL